MKGVVIGGTGLLGQAIGTEWPEDELVLAGSRDVDIRDPFQVNQFLAQHRPDWVVLAAAFPDVDGCERNPELADQVNHRGAIHVAKACREHGARLMFISTDYVFDGRKSSPYEVDDPVCPQSVYARSKAAGEDAVRRIQPGSCIARISWLFGPEKKCFANIALEWAKSGQPVRAVVDQRGIPNYNHDLAGTLAALVHCGAGETVHVTNAGETSWYEFACELMRAAGLDVTVEPITMECLARPARRPKYSALSDASLRRYGIQMRHWREALMDYLERRKQMAAIIATHQVG